MSLLRDFRLAGRCTPARKNSPEMLIKNAGPYNEVFSRELLYYGRGVYSVYGGREVYRFNLITFVTQESESAAVHRRAVLFFPAARITLFFTGQCLRCPRNGVNFQRSAQLLPPPLPPPPPNNIATIAPLPLHHIMLGTHSTAP